MTGAQKRERIHPTPIIGRWNEISKSSIGIVQRIFFFFHFFHLSLSAVLLCSLPSGRRKKKCPAKLADLLFPALDSRHSVESFTFYNVRKFLLLFFHRQQHFGWCKERLSTATRQESESRSKKARMWVKRNEKIKFNFSRFSLLHLIASQQPWIPRFVTRSMTNIIQMLRLHTASLFSWEEQSSSNMKSNHILVLRITHTMCMKRIKRRRWTSFKSSLRRLAFRMKS